jgi:hypothetical protein
VGVLPLSAMRVHFPPNLFPQALPPPTGGAWGPRRRARASQNRKGWPTVAYQLLGSGFIGSASWTLAAVGAFLFALAILAAFISSPLMD